ncbi:hypothetical protein JRO89_XS07G0226600 [Xanthoceras sorbifolium]|uniref:Uncharacterized protein n=1 Tax=Xanthoceras sorbifolium TaxID=99658 RepID=A0ABQ8HUP1_9ROSI|nr:hypothetical protein JRO89_XS07G0226600 [Xanthoceras sorbifolium]
MAHLSAGLVVEDPLYLHLLSPMKMTMANMPDNSPTPEERFHGYMDASPGRLFVYACRNCAGLIFLFAVFSRYSVLADGLHSFVLFLIARHPYCTQLGQNL